MILSILLHIAILSIPLQLLLGAVHYALGIRIPFAEALPYVLMLIYAVLSTILLLKTRIFNKVCFSMFAFCLFGLAGGLVYQAFFDPSRLMDVLIHGAGLYVIAVSFAIGQHFRAFIVDEVFNRVSVFAIFIFLICIIYLISFSYVAVREGLYFGPSTGLALLIYPLFLIKRQYLLCAVCILLVFFGGKRAVMVAIMVQTALLFYLHRRLARFILPTVIIIAASISAVVNLDAEDQSLWRAALSLGLDRLVWTAENIVVDPALASAGRISEIRSSWEQFVSEPIRLVVGGGVGWGFDSYDGTTLAYVHFSPLNYVYYFGIPVGILFLFVVLQRLRFLWRLSRGRSDVAIYCFVVVIALISEGFFSFTYPQTPLLWLLIGSGIKRAMIDKRSNINIRAK